LALSVRLKKSNALSLQAFLSPRRTFLHTLVFVGHTVDDAVVDIGLGREARATLEEMGPAVSWKEHKDGGHLAFLRIQGLDDIVESLA